MVRMDIYDLMKQVNNTFNQRYCFSSKRKNKYKQVRLYYFRQSQFVELDNNYIIFITFKVVSSSRKANKKVFLLFKIIDFKILNFKIKNVYNKKINV